MKLPQPKRQNKKRSEEEEKPDEGHLPHSEDESEISNISPEQITKIISTLSDQGLERPVENENHERAEVMVQEDITACSSCRANSRTQSES